MKSKNFATWEMCWIEKVGADRAVRHSISVAWCKWRDTCSLLTNRTIPLRYQGRVYDACVRTTMIYRAASWALTQIEEQMLQSCDRRMMRRMYGLSLRDQVASVEILRRIGLEDMLVVCTEEKMMIR